MSGVLRGSPIPDFRLPASTGQTLQRDAFTGKVAMVVFFVTDPRADGDRGRIRAYDGILSEFGARRTQVLGVLQETAAGVRRLSAEMDVNVPLLADPAGDMARDFGVPAGDAGPEAYTVVADSDGIVVGHFGPDDPHGRPGEVLELVGSLRG